MRRSIKRSLWYVNGQFQDELPYVTPYVLTFSFLISKLKQKARTMKYADLRIWVRQMQKTVWSGYAEPRRKAQRRVPEMQIQENPQAGFKGRQG